MEPERAQQRKNPRICQKLKQKQPRTIRRSKKKKNLELTNNYQIKEILDATKGVKNQR